MELLRARAMYGAGLDDFPMRQGGKVFLPKADAKQGELSCNASYNNTV